MDGKLYLMYNGGKDLVNIAIYGTLCFRKGEIL